MGTDTSPRMPLLEKVYDASHSSRKLALLRIESLCDSDFGNDTVNASGKDDGNNHINGDDDKNAERTSIYVDDESCSDGLADELVSLLQEAINSSEIAHIIKMLRVLQNLAIADVTLIEEVSVSAGFRQCLQALEQNQDREFNSVRKDATEIQASLSELETTGRLEPFTRSEMQSRLPLVFGIPQQQRQDNLQIMVHQVTSEEETDTHDTGFVMWPSSVLLARYIAENPELVLHSASTTTGDDADILELGAGCGLVGLTAAALLKQHNEETKEPDTSDAHVDNTNVIFTDYCATVLDNITRNLDLNDLSASCMVSGLDFFDQPGNDDSKYDKSEPSWIDMEDTKRPQVGLILAADVICYSNDATNVANTIHAALVEGGKAIVVSADDNRRFGVEAFPGACRDAGLEVTIGTIAADGSNSTTSISNDSCSDDELLAHDIEQTSMQGYDVQDYNLIMFTIDKPMSS